MSEDAKLPSGPDLDATAAEHTAKESTNGDVPVPIPTAILPKCPYCNADPFKPEAIPWNAENGVQLLIFFCGGCQKTINVIILRMPQPRVVPPAAGRIHLPQ